MSATGTQSIAVHWRRLTWAALAYLALLVAHDVDHIVNEADLYDLSAPFWVLLPFQYGVVLAGVGLIMRHDRRGATAGAVLGLLAVVGFVVIHALPFGLASYSDTDAGLLNWSLVFVPAAVALYMGVTGLRLRGALRGPVSTGRATAR